MEVEPDALIVYGATMRLTHRADTSDIPLLTVRFSSPMPNVIRVQMYHHKGGQPRKPEFQLLPQPASKVEIHDKKQAATLTRGRLTVHVEKAGDWKITFKDGDRVITNSGSRGIGIIDTDEGQRRGGSPKGSEWLSKDHGLSIGLTSNISAVTI